MTVTPDPFVRWRWYRAPAGGWPIRSEKAAGRRLFHAHDGNNNLACEPSMGLVSGDVPEGDRDLADLCPVCAKIVLVS